MPRARGGLDRRMLGWIGTLLITSARCYSICTHASPFHGTQPARLSPPQLFGEGRPQLVQEEIQAIAGLWKIDLSFEKRYAAAISLYLEASGRVIPMDEKLPYNLGEDCRAWAWWSADRAVVAGAVGDDELSFTLQLGNLRLEGQGQRKDFRCNKFVGKAIYEGAHDDPVGSFTMRLALPAKTNVAALKEKYLKRIAERPPPRPEFAFSDFVGRWIMGLSEDTTPRNAVFFPAVLAANGTWSSEKAVPRLTGTWGMCSGDDSHGAGPDAYPTGSNVWLIIHSTIGRPHVYLQGRPGQLAALTSPLLAGYNSGTGRLAPNRTKPSVADQVDGKMWEPSQKGKAGREYFGEFRLLRESALVEIIEAAKKEARAQLQKAMKERAERAAAMREQAVAEAAAGMHDVDESMRREAQQRAEAEARGGRAAADTEATRDASPTRDSSPTRDASPPATPPDAQPDAPPAGPYCER